MNLHFHTFRLQPPHAPLSSGHTSCSGQAWPPIRLSGLSAVLRTSSIPSSLVSRIRPNRVCVAALVWAAVLRTVCSLSVARHPVLPRRSYFQLPGGKLRQEGTFTLCARSLSSALGTSRCDVTARLAHHAPKLVSSAACAITGRQRQRGRAAPFG